MSRFIRLLIIIVLFSSDAQSKALAPEQVPEPLKPWIGWVLEGSPERSCPFIYNAFKQKRCSWPARLKLDLTSSNGKFSIGWKVYSDSWVTLPGDGRRWPLNVTVNNKAAVVIDRQGAPSVKLSAGTDRPVTYQIEGEFIWDSIPDSLGIPADTGLIDLAVNGSTIDNPAIKEGQLWLKESDVGMKKPETMQNAIDIQVFRKLTDDVPLQLLTQLVLDVSGEQREVKLAKPLLDGFIPLNLQSPLPARLEEDGKLLVQLRPGRWRIDILARSVKEVNEIPFRVDSAKQPKADQAKGLEWPQTEIWVFDARPDLRLVEIQNVSSIDASQTNLPEDWRPLPAFRVNQGQSMRLKQIRRGDPDPEPNQLNLTRKLWLDFDGSGYTIKDSINGKMTLGWRLNALSETLLGRVMLDGNNQLITQQEGSAKKGVEVRKGLITLEADSRNEGSIGDISAVGWEQRFRQVNAELYLPPGWRLLAAAGVDNVPNSWISRWTLLDLFLVLIAALATARLWNRLWGLIALLTLSLIWHEPESPHFVWLDILMATALLRVLPAGRFQLAVSWLLRAFWLALILIAVPFMIDQVRAGIYPQLEKPWQSIAGPRYPQPQAISAMSPSDAVGEVEMMAKSAVRSKLRDYRGGADYPSEDKSAEFERIDPKAKIQTGPGLPQWQWHTVMLSWNGSVDSRQRLDLWYLTPSMTMLLNFARVVLIAVMALLMFGMAEKFRFRGTAVNSMMIWFLLTPGLLLPSPKAHADFPDQAMLETLKNKLLEAPDCLPGCARIPQMQLAITGKELRIRLVIHAQQAVAVPLPADYEQWFPSRITVDGEAAEGLFRRNNNLWAGLTEGVHRIEMLGMTPALDKFNLPLPLRPSRVVVESTEWEILGVRENGLADNQLQFSRRRQTPESGKQPVLASGVLPSFFRIERTLMLGLDWRATTRVIRASPAKTPVLLNVPLLPGESVVSPGIHVRDNQVEVDMGAGQALTQWQSTLAKSGLIEMKAAGSDQWAEVWRIDVSPIWHIETSGIPMIHQNSEARWIPEFHPWPGESISLKITRPIASPGQTLTIDSSRLGLKPGSRSRDADLTLNMRSSQGGQHTLILPESAVLQSVAIDGIGQPIRLDGRKLTLPVKPGKQAVSITWQEAAVMSPVISTPSVNLGQESVNVSLHIGLGTDRWVFWVMGPKMGPAVLFWGVLIVIVVLSLGLSKIPLTPLKSGQWFLLLIGLSQVPLLSALIVVGWLMLLGWRAGRSAGDVGLFNVLQVFIGLLTLASLSVLFFAVSQGLLDAPNMQILGNQSSAFSFNWYQDRSASVLPTATVVSVPVYVYRFLMLAWSLWLAVSLLNWLKWGWSCFSSNGLWVKTRKKNKEAQVEPKGKAES
ncbi:MAG: hypothetical protein ACU83O_10420 [Gammaproteobacteria bacterium]